MKGYFIFSNNELKRYKMEDKSLSTNRLCNIKKFELDYHKLMDEKVNISTLLHEIESDEQLSYYSEIIVGLWDFGRDCQDILDLFVRLKDKLVNLESLFIGDIKKQITEVSWIHQADYSKLIKSLPNLKRLKIKGSDSLVISPLQHSNLESIEIISAGLPKTVIKDIADSDLPALKELILYLGTSYYGFDGSVEDIRYLLQSDKFPSLEKLHIVNSTIQEEVLLEIIDSKLLKQLKEISISYGNLRDSGGKVILDNIDKLSHLDKIEIDWHYMTQDMEELLLKSQLCINIKNRQSISNKQKQHNKEICNEKYAPMLVE